ncbi:DUF4294 domain-containing protein [Thermophagus xiamenensis]|uniref:DUF4294 domain-containing protein n=1 Tax=Thermophagus xiamenensis TaxID=385682 RepID=A0A1I2F9A3_9BACT|nr:DUF4294 domain-containing protein [Thermophagus xiamenensis]SFF01377.1 protein of unknown function [Thermophagus xiamenensis]
MKLCRYIITCVFLLPGFVFELKGQEVEKANMAGKEVYMLKSKVSGSDTVPHVMLSEVKIVPRWRFRNKRERRVYSRLVRNIKVTLPYAKIAAAKLEEINAHLAQLESEKERKEYLRVAEKKLFQEFEQPLRKLSFSQGRLLIKLIDRETGDTSYNLIKEYKGSFSAFFWQSVARLFGSNLKAEYDAEREDRMIEHIIIMIENGML